MKLSHSIHRRLRKLQSRRWYWTGRLNRPGRSWTAARHERDLPLEDGRLLRFEVPAAGIRAQAALLLQHHFDLLGTGPVDCSTPAGQDLAKGRRELPDHGYLPIDWHRDFSSAYRWDQTSQPWKTLEAVGAGVEIKWPWELSRF